jgi:hypothetical protein
MILGVATAYLAFDGDGKNSVRTLALLRSVLEGAKWYEPRHPKVNAAFE